MSQVPQSNNQVQYYQNHSQQPIQPNQQGQVQNNQNQYYQQVPSQGAQQIPPNQYPPGQYHPGQYPQGQYPPSQNPQGQYPPRQMQQMGGQFPINQSSQVQIPQIVDNIEQLKTMYLENLCCLTTTYEIMWIICLILEYLGCQSLQAANLLISIQVFMLVASGLLYFVYTLVDKTHKLIALGAHAFFLILSYILNIASFALSVKYPSFIQNYTSAGCYYYVDELDSDYSIKVEYTEAAQYPVLIMYIIQYFYSTYFLYIILRKDYKVYQYIRGLNQVRNEKDQQMVIVQ